MQVIIVAVSSLCVLNTTVTCPACSYLEDKVQIHYRDCPRMDLEDWNNKTCQFYFIKTRAETSRLFAGAGNQGSVAISAASVVSVGVISSIGSIAQPMPVVAIS